MAENESLQVVTELSPPYQTITKNQVSGSATQLVKDILSAAEIPASFDMYPWARAYAKALNEPNTLIYSMAKTTQRSELFHWLFPVAHYKFGLVAMSARADLKIKNLNQLSNFVLAVQRDDIAHHWAIEQGLEEGKHLIICSDIGCSWQLLLKNKVDFIVESPELIDSMLAKYSLPTNLAEYVIAIPELELTGYLAANKNIDTKLLRKLKLTIKNKDLSPKKK
ncbi:ABC transporter substrate-binding protein [Paraglaciecola sp. L3A3]|uniref:substrate-binding periplasmic protein n=1 Tax=Paraglaciecola sp. L3A3 TaxID=2686358 RepID=UPI00131D981D|nr:transporter substrate-binding domain-containing protein [Paraglaciecola sp. L3A3]